MAARPGIMLYFELRQALKLLKDEEKGRLLDAILEYGEFGVLPEFDGMLGMAWAFLQPKLDRDKESYDRQVLQKQYATFSREIKKRGLPAVSYDEWKGLSDIERDRLISADIERYPTTTGTGTTIGTTTGITTGTTSISTSGNLTTTGNPTATGKGAEADFESRRREQIARLSGVTMV